MPVVVFAALGAEASPLFHENAVGLFVYEYSVELRSTHDNT